MFKQPIMIRTFHAVGHGCFVTERFRIRNGIDDIKIVYDCGGYKNKIEREINNTFVENDIIDALFISHFDYDHVNGLPILLKRCKQISNLWIPYLTKKQKCIMALSYLSKEEALQRDYINIYINIILKIIFEPESLFGEKETEINKILPLRNDNEYREDIEIDENKGNAFTFSSREKIEIKGLNKDWLYVPFYHFDSSYYDKIFNEIKRDSLLYKFIEDNSLKKDIFIETIKSKENFKIIRQKLNNIFEKNGGSNNNSLILYSGHSNKFNCYQNFSNNFIQCLSNNRCQYCDNIHSQISSGCLYFGDYNAKKYYDKDIVFFEEYLNKCGVILLPHHGSINNFNDNLLNKNFDYRFAIACHGKKNQYGVPSDYVCDKLRLYNKRMISVTEDRNTTIKFEIYI